MKFPAGKIPPGRMLHGECVSNITHRWQDWGIEGGKRPSIFQSISQTESFPSEFACSYSRTETQFFFPTLCIQALHNWGPPIFRGFSRAWRRKWVRQFTASNQISAKGKRKLGAYAIKRVAAGAHLPTPWLFEPNKKRVIPYWFLSGLGLEWTS